MPHAITALKQETDGLDNHNQAELQLLLKHKLHGVPALHLPALTLADILEQTPRALNIPNIPPDIQLPFFLHNRAAIEHYAAKPVKDEEKQDMDITRAIWFYRLDEAHQFQRFHDFMRWNTAMFVALLALHSESNDKKHSRRSEVTAVHRRRDTVDSYRPGLAALPGSNDKETHIPISPAAMRFIKSYLGAVLEHHNTPTSRFTTRESFIRAWKTEPWELFTVFGGAQKKLLKNAMKKLTPQWEAELRIAKTQFGRERYESAVGKFVGGLLPGRRGQGVGAMDILNEGKSGDCDEKVDVGNLVLTDQGEGEEASRNELLDALLSPYVPQTKEDRKQDGKRVKNGVVEVQGTPVTDLRCAIAAL